MHTAALATGQLKRTIEFITGFFRGDVDRATNGITTKQGALWAAQDFNTFHIQNIQNTT